MHLVNGEYVNDKRVACLNICGNPSKKEQSFYLNYLSFSVLFLFFSLLFWTESRKGKLCSDKYHKCFICNIDISNLVYGVLTPFSIIFQLYRAISFIFLR